MLLDLLKEIEDQALLDHREYTRAQQMHWCEIGMPVWWWDVLRALRLGRYYCGAWRYCEICFKRRVKHYNDRATRAEASGMEVNLVNLTIAQGRKLSRRIGKANYMRIPGDNNLVSYIISSCTVADNDLTEVSHPLSTVDWEHLIRSMPENSRITGDLGKKKKVEHEGYVKVRTVAIEGLTDAQIIEADKVVTETLNQDEPEDIETLQFQLDELHEAFVEMIKSLGGKVINVGWKRLGCNLTSNISSKEETVDDESILQQLIDELFTY